MLSTIKGWQGGGGRVVLGEHRGTVERFDLCFGGGLGIEIIGRSLVSTVTVGPCAAAVGAVTEIVKGT